MTLSISSSALSSPAFDCWEPKGSTIMGSPSTFPLHGPHLPAGLEPRFQQLDGVEPTVAQSILRLSTDEPAGPSRGAPRQPVAVPGTATSPGLHPVEQTLPTPAGFALGILLGLLSDPIKARVKELGETIVNLTYDPSRRPVPASTKQPTDGASGTGGGGAGGAGGSGK
jgi:hypothetical protein